MSTLTLEFWTEDNDFCMYAESGEFEKELTLTGQAEQIVARFNTIYEILDVIEKNSTHRQDELRKALEFLGERILTPFAEQIQACSLVRFLVYDDLIRCAFDLLLFQGEYLFLQRPVCYQVEQGTAEDKPDIELNRALVIADLTADPEKACAQVSKLIPEAEYVEVKDAGLSMIREAAQEVDVLLISAHGDLEDDNSGGLWINDDDMLDANLVGELEAWIVYFDSCSQGVNMEYVQALQDESDVQFYLAPIVSNDAGDSSTRTMVWFFTDVLKHKDVIRGLYDTRKRLYDYYRAQKRLDPVTSLNKAFVFRLYEFVDA